MLKDFVPDCDSLNIAGVEVDIFFSCIKEHKKNPRTKAQITPTSTVAGDKNRVGEAYDFTIAPVGEGYWRKMTVITDSGMIEVDGTVKDSTSTLKSGLKFKLKGFGAVEKEFAENVAGCCGMVYLVTDKEGVTHEVGTVKNPAIVDKFKGGTGGEFRGFEYEIMAMGRLPRTVDTVAFPLDVTPNV